MVELTGSMREVLDSSGDYMNVDRHHYQYLYWNLTVNYSSNFAPTLWHIEIVCDFKKDWNSVNNIPKKSGLLTKEWNITEMLVTEHYKQLHVFVLLTVISSNNLLNKLRGTRVLKVDFLEHFGGRSIWSVFMDVYLIYILVMHIVRGCLRPKPLGSI